MTIRLAVVSHTDMDGYASSYLLDILLREVSKFEVEFYNVDYADIVKTLEELATNELDYTGVLITDLPMNEPVIDFLTDYSLELGSTVTIIDHHTLCEYDALRLKALENVKLFHNISRSAAFLTYEFVSDLGVDIEHIKGFINTVSAADIFDMSSTNEFYIGRHNVQVFGSFLNIMTSVVGHEYLSMPIKPLFTAFEKAIRFHNPGDSMSQYEDSLKRFIQSEFSIAEDRDFSGDTVLTIFSEMAAQIVQSKSAIKEIAGRKVLVVKQMLNSTLTFAILYRTNPDVDIIFMRKGCGVEMRMDTGRNPKINLGEFAQTQGGGGHQGAAGFPLSSPTPSLFQQALTELSKYLEGTQE